MRGIAARDLPNGARYLAIHYSADPDKTEEWARQEEPNPGPTWLRQMELHEDLVENALFPAGCFRTIQRIPRLTRWVRFWDLADTAKKAGDFTVGALVGLGEGGRIVVADVKRWQRQWPETRDGVRDAAGNVEEKGLLQIVQDDFDFIGTLYDPALGEKRPEYHVGMETDRHLSLYNDLQRNDLFLKVPIWPLRSRDLGDKKQRASTWAARASNGLVDVVEGPWNGAFFIEAKVFDGLGLTKDDQIDAVSGAVELLYAKTGTEVKSEPPPPEGSYAYYQRVAALAKRAGGKRR